MRAFLRFANLGSGVGIDPGTANIEVGCVQLGRFLQTGMAYPGPLLRNRKCHWYGGSGIRKSTVDQRSGRVCRWWMEEYGPASGWLSRWLFRTRLPVEKMHQEEPSGRATRNSHPDQPSGPVIRTSHPDHFRWKITILTSTPIDPDY